MIHIVQSDSVNVLVGMLEQALKKEIVRSLNEAIGSRKVLADGVDLRPYKKDTFNVKFSEQEKISPDIVVLPESTEDVQKIVKIAAKHKIPLIPKGGGSSRTGMLVPIHGGIIVDTIKMNRLLEVKKSDLCITVQPGISLIELERQLERHGVSLHQEQGSLKVATVGGSISTSGFSHKHQKYGSISDRVMSLEVVLADGSILRTGPKVLYTSTGYRLHQIFIGAEGTLGIITEATLRIEPIPEARDGILAFYDDFWIACEVAHKVMRSGVTFTAGEAYEPANATVYGAPSGKKAIFYAGFEGTAGEVLAELEFVKTIISDTGGVLAEQDVARKYVQSYDMIFCGARATTGFEDTITTYIPMDKIKEFYGEMWGRIMPKYGLKPVPGESLSLDVGRYRMLGGRFFIPKSDEGWEGYRKALRELAIVTTKLGGSISACHGVGIEHRDNIDLEYSAVALDIMRSMKKVFDPYNIMNPGKKLPD